MKAIDGEELLNRIYDCGFPDIDQYGRIEKSKVAEIIHKLPELTTNEKGKWIIHQNGLLLTSECNNCHCFVGTINMNFCPNCGADMREADNG